MEDYIRGVLCGSLLVQNGTRDGAKRKRTFVVLSDSRMDYYLTDPRPSFTAKIDATYFLTKMTRVHRYLELNARAPPNSFCLTTDKSTDVYVADSEHEAETWIRHLTERLEAIATMLKGTLMLRKEFHENQQVKRFVLRTKYRYKERYVELGRSTLRFCKPSDHKTKPMKQFALTGSSFAGQETTTYLRKLSVVASYSIPVEPNPKTLKGIRRIERMRRDEEEQCNCGDGALIAADNEVRPKGSHVAAFYPLVVTTGQSYLILAAPTEQSRTHWILAIRLRIIALKYRHNINGRPQHGPGRLPAPNNEACQLQGVVDAQIKPGGPWKQHYVELDNGMLRVKKSERKLGSIFEAELVPTCRVTPLLDKANAFTVRSLGCEVALAPASIADARHWIELIRTAAASVQRERYQRIFHADIQALLRNSITYAVDIAAEAKAGLVVEKHNKRIFVLNHELPAPRSLRRMTVAALVRRVSILTTSTPNNSARTLSLSSTPPSTDSPVAAEPTTSKLMIPQGSVLVGISQFGMLHDSVDTIWHTLRQNKGCYKQAKKLVFRAPAVKEGVLRAKLHAADSWMVLRCRLAHGMFTVEEAQNPSSVLVTLPLRNCEVELFSDDDCINGIRILATTGNSPPRPAVFMNIAVDDDAFLWFAMLHMEVSVAQNSANFPITLAMLNNAPLSSSSNGTQATRDEKLALEQAKSFRDCTVAGTRVEEIEKFAREQERILVYHELENSTKAVQHPVEQRVTSRLNQADVIRFFQHLDAVGSGKVSTAGLLSTMKLITKHVRQRQNNHKQPPDSPEGSSSDDPLGAFYAALDAIGPENSCLTLEQFSTVMASVSDPRIVELARKASLNDIQCI